jgi:hypothetical protein
VAGERIACIITIVPSAQQPLFGRFDRNSINPFILLVVLSERKVFIIFISVLPRMPEYIKPLSVNVIRVFRPLALIRTS